MTRRSSKLVVKALALSLAGAGAYAAIVSRSVTRTPLPPSGSFEALGEPQAPLAAAPSMVTGGAQAAPLSPTGEAQGVTLPSQERGAATAHHAATAGETNDVTEVASAERIHIRFQGYAELTGEYRVGADGTISIPVIGRVPIGRLTPDEFEALLAKRVARATGKDAYVTVEIREYKPVFVSGYVSKPGAFPWHSGMSIMQAVAMAGGTFRSASESTPAASNNDDVILERLLKAVARQARNWATLALLEAERKNADVELPATLVALVGQSAAQDLVRTQQATLQSRRTSFEAKKTALSKAIDVTASELTGLTEQAKRLKAQLEVRRDYKGKIDDLSKRGIIRTDRSMEEMTRLADLEDRATTISVGIARVHGIRAQLERDRINLVLDRQADIEADVFKVNGEIGQTEIEIEAARTAYRKAVGQEPPMRLVSGPMLAAQSTSIKYEIVRASAAGSTSLPSDPIASVKPGDVVVVKLE